MMRRQTKSHDHDHDTLEKESLILCPSRCLGAGKHPNLEGLPSKREIIPTSSKGLQETCRADSVNT